MNIEVNINKYFTSTVEYKSKRDEIISKIVDDINLLRVGTIYKPVTKRLMAVKINQNPFLSKDDTALEELFNECHNKMDYKKLWWVLKNK